jgi:hypothetical protein
MMDQPGLALLAGAISLAVLPRAVTRAVALPLAFALAILTL